MQTYFPTSKTTSLLVHAGDLQVNLTGAPTPGQFVDLADTVAAQNTNLPQLVANYGSNYGYEQYVPPDAGVLAASNYDELVVDVRVLIAKDGSVGALSNITLNSFRQLAMTDRPFWLVVRCDGYRYQYSTRNSAVVVAQNVVYALYQECKSLILLNRLQGFAFISPDLNVRFSDGTVIDRLFQNQLVQACWDFNTACMFITCRPGDATTIVGPVVTNNVNSGKALPYSILGCNPAHQDRMVILYPTPLEVGHSVPVLTSMLAGTLGTRGRDPGFPLNLSTSIVVPLDERAYASDLNGGTLGTTGEIAKVLTFAAALGVTSLGVSSNLYVVDTATIMPEDSLVNTTGAFRVGSLNGITTVRYSDGLGGTVSRSFDAHFAETFV
jgi:hypothetical protein